VDKRVPRIIERAPEDKKIYSHKKRSSVKYTAVNFESIKKTAIFGTIDMKTTVAKGAPS
jgi:hypothetical protein